MEVDMARIVIVTDSNSGITQRQAEEYGVAVLPMPFFIDGECYYEDKNLSQEEFYKKLEQDADISTQRYHPDYRSYRNSSYNPSSRKPSRYGSCRSR